MKPIRSIEGWIGAASVLVNDIWIPGKYVEATIARYAKLIFCLNPSPEYPYSLRGSATGIRLGDRCFIFCCKHQIADYRPDDVTVPADDSGKLLISGSRFIQARKDKHNAEEEVHDVCAITFNPEDYEIQNLSAHFFAVEQEHIWTGETDAHFFVFGYPTHLRDVDYESPAHIAVKKTVTSARYVRPTNASGVHVIEMTRTSAFATDGLSGGPVFYLGRDQNGFFMGLAGMVLRGGETSDFLHFFEARYLLRFLQETSEEVEVLDRPTNRPIDAPDGC